MQTREKRGKHADYSPHASLNFADFLELIELLAPKVYNKVPFSVAVRKLLLENIFILSGRRVPIVDMSSLDDRESMELLKSKELSNSITNIFKYYAHKAELRRTHEVANKSITRGQGITNNRNAVTNKSAIPIPVSPETKEALKSLRDLWGFEEYAEFCHDFNLKSTALLTGIQVGDVFLTVVPLDNTLKTIKGLNFDQFCKVLLCMALVAYRDISNPKITSVCKLKELLLFMWKTINSSEKATKAVNSRSSGVASHAGSLNVYGSGLFAVQFLNLWQRDNFCNYTVAPPEQNIEDGVSVSVIYIVVI